MAVLKKVAIDSRVIHAAKEELIRNICKSSNFYEVCNVVLRDDSVKFYSERVTPDKVSLEEGGRRLVAALKLGYDLVMSTYKTIPEPSAVTTKFVADMKEKFKKAGLDFEGKEE